MKLGFSPRSLRDLQQIMEYIAQDSPTSAARFVDLLERSCAEIAKAPLLYRVRPELGPDVRLAPIGDYIRSEFVRVYRVTHGSRNLGPLVHGEKQ